MTNKNRHLAQLARSLNKRTATVNSNAKPEHHAPGGLAFSCCPPSQRTRRTHAPGSGAFSYCPPPPTPPYTPRIAAHESLGRALDASTVRCPSTFRPHPHHSLQPPPNDRRCARKSHDRPFSPQRTTTRPSVLTPTPSSQRLTPPAPTLMTHFASFAPAASSSSSLERCLGQARLP